MVMILIGDLNAIAPIISNFFLCSYALINYACFDNSFAHSPGFRPGFRFYNMWVSLVGTMLCVTVMFIVSWFTALLTFFFFALLFMYIYRRKPDVNWGCSTQAHSYRNAIQGVTRLEHTDEHVKNYRPQVLQFDDLWLRHPLHPSDSVFGMIRRLNEQLRNWLKKRHIKSFFACVANPNRRLGAQSLLQASGLGKLRPNILVIGFKQNWAKPIANLLVDQEDNNSYTVVDQSSDVFTNALADINNYFGIIQDAFDSNMGVAVFRSGSGLDYSDTMRLHNLFNKAMPHVSSASNVDAASTATDGLKPENNQQSNGHANSTKPNQVHLTVEATTEYAFEESPLDILNDYLDEETEEEDSTVIDDAEAQLIPSGSEPNESINQSTENSHLQKTTARTTTNDYFYLDPGVGVAEEQKPLLLPPQKREGSDNESRRHRCPPPGFERGMLRRRSKEKVSLFSLMSTRRLTTAQRELLLSINRFQRKIKRGTIDVWWLYDDGGLTLLIPYLLTLPKSYLENAKMRIFTIATSTSGMEQEQRNMATLLSKFRIEYSDLHVIADISRKPKKTRKGARLAEFDKLIAPFIVVDEKSRSSNTKSAHREGLITQSELSAQREKTMRQLRMAELLQQHSTDADLVVLSLPVPRRGLVSSTLYMAWIDLMTRNLPPTLLENQENKDVDMELHTVEPAEENARLQALYEAIAKADANKNQRDAGHPGP
uniref:Uncharacterized protein n=1 Tax=Ditylenchus dipsaci TaxID=166011 RepID=A0A915CRU4_9BILA